MRELIVLLIYAVGLFGQVAKQANDRYQSKEGREKVAATLGDPHRDARQKPKELVAALKIKPGMTVVDLGTGIGYMLPFLSRAVGPEGRVIAVDIFEDFLDRAKEKAQKENLSNVTFILGTDRDPKLPENAADVVLTLDVYHHFDYPELTLAGIRQALKPNGRLAIVEFYKRGFRDPGHIRLDDADLVKEVEANSFRVLSSKPFVPDTQYIAIFAKK